MNASVFFGWPCLVLFRRHCNPVLHLVSLSIRSAEAKLILLHKRYLHLLRPEGRDFLSYVLYNDYRRTGLVTRLWLSMQYHLKQQPSNLN